MRNEILSEFITNSLISIQLYVHILVEEMCIEIRNTRRKLNPTLHLPVLFITAIGKNWSIVKLMTKKRV